MPKGASDFTLIIARPSFNRSAAKRFVSPRLTPHHHDFPMHKIIKRGGQEYEQHNTQQELQKHARSAAPLISKCADQNCVYGKRLHIPKCIIYYHWPRELQQSHKCPNACTTHNHTQKEAPRACIWLHKEYARGGKSCVYVDRACSNDAERRAPQSVHPFGAVWINALSLYVEQNPIYCVDIWPLVTYLGVGFFDPPATPRMHCAAQRAGIWPASVTRGHTANTTTQYNT